MSFKVHTKPVFNKTSKFDKALIDGDPLRDKYDGYDKTGSNNPNYKYGMSHTKLDRVYHGMKNRCSNETHIMWSRYGGRGIKVCDEWITVVPFMFWALENGYQEGLQLDRIDNDGDYSPSNCRFVTRTDNIRNGSHTKLTVNSVSEIKYLLKEGSLYQKDIANIYGIHQGVISKINRKIAWKEVEPLEINQ